MTFSSGIHFFGGPGRNGLDYKGALHECSQRRCLAYSHLLLSNHVHADVRNPRMNPLRLRAGRLSPHAEAPSLRRLRRLGRQSLQRQLLKSVGRPKPLLRISSSLRWNTTAATRRSGTRRRLSAKLTTTTRTTSTITRGVRLKWYVFFSQASVCLRLSGYPAH